MLDLDPVSGALQIRLLGQFRLSVDDRPVEGLQTARLQSLVAYLLLHADAPQPRAALAFAFWPDASEANGRNNLRQLLHQLRQTLPDAERYLKADAASVRWAAPEPLRLDVALFEAAVAEAELAARAGDGERRRSCLERAVSLCQGPLLPSCYDDWIGPARERIARRCKEAMAALVGLLEEQREYAGATARVRHWLEHDPLDERAHRWLMRLLALDGDRAGALQAYGRCAEALRRELGASPSAETLRAYERIRDAEPDAGSRAEPRDVAASVPRLVGRRTEWASLRQAWERAAAGPAFFAVVKGEAGVGKSRLAEELLTWAERQGVTTARTRCYAAEGRLSLAPASEWLRCGALRPHLARLEEVWRVEVARILPELVAAQPGLPRPAPMTEFGDRLRFFEGLARAVLAAPQPTLLLIDDLQWCDRETLEWLHFLARFDPGARVLVLGTARPEELDAAHPLTALLRDLNAAAQLAELALEPLDAAETAALAAQVGNRTIDVDAATRLYHQTEGNPLFIVETMRAEAAGGASGAPQQGLLGLPPRAHAVIAGRLAQLSEGAREVAAAAAVVGRAFGHDVLASVIGNEDTLARALDELWRKRVVREQGPNAYDFTHDKLREVAYAETSAPLRRRLHRRVAEALTAAHAADLDSVSGQLAAHFESAGLLERAIPHYARAAAVAQDVYAHDEALALVGRGLALVRELPPSARRDAWELELQLALAPSYRVTLGWAAPELGAVLDRALALCDRVGTGAQRAQVLYGMQSFYIVAGRLEKSALITDEMVHVLRETLDAEPPRSAFAMLAGVRLQMGRFQEACDDIDALVRDADPRQLQRLQESQGLNYEVVSRAWQSHALWCLGQPGHGARARLPGARDRARARPAVQPVDRRDLPGAPAAAARRRRDVHPPGRGCAHAVDALQGDLLPHLGRDPGRLRPNARAARRCVARGPARRDRELQANGRAAAAAVLPRPARGGAPARRAGRRGTRRARGGLLQSRETNERWWDAELHRLRAELLLAAGAGPDEAEAALRRALEIARAQQARSLELRAARALAGLWTRAARDAEARALLEPVCASFVEGLDTPDVRGARQLLESLR